MKSTLSVPRGRLSVPVSFASNLVKNVLPVDVLSLSVVAVPSSPAVVSSC